MKKVAIVTGGTSGIGEATAKELARRGWQVARSRCWTNGGASTRWSSKAALETMSFSLARSLAPEVRVNVVAPGHTRTPWHEAARGAAGAAESSTWMAGCTSRPPDN